MNNIYYLVNYDYFENNDGPIFRMTVRSVEDYKQYIVDVQDKRLAPCFYILESDFDDFRSICEETKVWELVTKYEKEEVITSEFDEPVVRIETKFPRHVRFIRDALDDSILTFQADIKYEKKVAQQLKLKTYLQIDEISKYGFTSLDNIKPIELETPYKLKFNICYWDIETDGTHVNGKQFSDCRFASRIPIISYVVFNNFEQRFTYYGWRSDWEDEVYETEHATQLGEKALNMPIFEDYPTKFPCTVKKFHDEKDMHKQFLEDFKNAKYDGIMTFNGRGGNRIVNKEGEQRRTWYTGFDMPMFIERCKSLNLHKDIEKLSIIPATVDSYGRIKNSSVRLYLKTDKFGNERAREYRIKCMPQHDFMYDSLILGYSDNHYKMKRKNLDTYLNYFFGFGKVEHEGSSVYDMHINEWSKELRYNLVDVEGLYALDTYFMYIQDVSMRALRYGGKIEDGVYASRLHDHIKLWYTNGKYVLPTRYYEANTFRENQWKGLIDKKVGGYNLPVTPHVYGYHKTEIGAIFDFSKLYPSCLRSLNADTRTKVNLEYIDVTNEGIFLVDRHGRRFSYFDLARCPSGWFRKDEPAIDTIIFDEMIADRNKYKRIAADYKIKEQKATNPEEKEYYKLMYKNYYTIQFSLKGLINGKFGTTGMKSMRSFDYVVYNAAPSTGQLMIIKTMELLKKYGYTPFFASTDSSMVILKESYDKFKAWAEATDLVKKINEELDTYQREEFNIYKNYNDIGCEKLFNIAIMFDKRRYILSTVIMEEAGEPIELTEPYVYVKGLELVRRDSADITYDIQMDFIQKIVDRVPQEEIFEWLRNIDEHFEEYQWKYVCTKAGISMSVDEGSGIKYEACRNANTYFDKHYDSGSTPYLGYFPSKGYPLTINGLPVVTNRRDGAFVCAFGENDQWAMQKLGFKLDYAEMKQKNIINKIEPFIELIFGEKYGRIKSDPSTMREL